MQKDVERIVDDIFKIWDDDENGYLTEDEIITFIKELLEANQINYPNSYNKDYMKILDKSKNRYITKKELAKIILNCNLKK